MARPSRWRPVLACSCLLAMTAAFLLPAPGSRAAQRDGTASSGGHPRGGVPVTDPLEHVDRGLQAGLERVVSDLDLDGLAASRQLAVALVDLGAPGASRFAAVNGDRMIYAANLPKIAILLGAFDAADRGALRLTAGLREQMARMIRLSDNAAASLVLDQVGFPAVARALQRPSLRLYDPRLGGGLWVGKAYGRDRYWRRDPVANLSHGATARQTARFFVMLHHGELVSASASAEMKRLLAEPGIHHKFVRGLESRPGARIYRKSGTWRDFHADAALVERADATYVAVGLVQDSRGSVILERLIVALDDLVRGRTAASPAGGR